MTLPPLIDASAKGDVTTVKRLLAEDGVDVNQAPNDGPDAWMAGATPLYHASQKGHTEVVKVLLHAGADVNQADINDYAPLYLASREFHTEVVKVLLHAGADVNQANTFGSTPLYIASEKGRTEVVKVLLHAGADVHQANNNGWTPLHIANGKGHTDILALLVFHGAVPKDSDLPSLRGRLGPFLKAMKTDYAAMLAFKTCLRGVGVGHALRGIRIYGDHPIRCIESYLLPCCRGTCFPLAQARRTIMHLWVDGEDGRVAHR